MSSLCVQVERHCRTAGPVAQASTVPTPVWVFQLPCVKGGTTAPVLRTSLCQIRQISSVPLVSRTSQTFPQFAYVIYHF